MAKASRNASGDLQAVVNMLAADGIFPRGDLIFVCNAAVVPNASLAGSAGNNGSIHAPFASLTTAITAATANNGDVIVGLEGHVEIVTAAAGLAFSKAGLTCWAQPTPLDDRKPTISFTTATTADANFTASTSMVGWKYNCGIDSLASPLDVDAADVSFINSTFVESTAVLRCLEWINVGSASHRFRLLGFKTTGIGAYTTVASKDYFLTVVTSNDVEIGGYGDRRSNLWWNGNSGVLQFITGVCNNVQVHDVDIANLKGNVGIVNDGGQVHTGKFRNMTLHADPTGGSPALATAFIDISNAKWGYDNVMATNDNAERAAAIGTAST